LYFAERHFVIGGFPGCQLKLDQRRIVFLLGKEIFAQPVGGRPRNSPPEIPAGAFITRAGRFFIAQHSMALGQPEQRNITTLGGGIGDQEFLISLNRVVSIFRE
jgi:hypothetical protein